jgi:hypothetical protein
LPPSRPSSIARRQPPPAASARETLRAELNHHISRVARRSTPEALANADSRLALSLRLVLLADALYEAGTRGTPDDLHHTDAERSSVDRHRSRYGISARHRRATSS